MDRIRNAGKQMASKKQIEAASAYYARASAIRAVHGTIPDQDDAADRRYWRTVAMSVKEDIRNMVSAIFAAAQL